MKKLLYTLLGLEVLSGVIMFFTYLSSSWLVAVVYLAVALLGIVPTIVLIRHIDDIDYLCGEINRLHRLVKQLSDNVERELPEIKNHAGGDVSRGVWECLKCGAVNKGGVSRCEGCGAEYSALNNPTDEDRSSKKFSRWVK